MSALLVQALVALHRWLLRAYPRDFEATFGDEMQAVFAEALEQAGRQGVGLAVLVFARELAHLPWLLLGAHWRASRKARLTAAVLQTEIGMSPQRASRGFFAAGTIVILLSFALWLLAVTGWGIRGGALLPGVLLLTLMAWLLAWGTGRLVGRLQPVVGLGAGLVCLAGLAWPTSLLVEHVLKGRPPVVGLLLFSLPPVALIVAAALLLAGLTHLQARPSADASRGVHTRAYRRLDWVSAACFGLSALLTIKVLHNVYWLMVWDATYDPLQFLWLIPTGLASVFGGLLLATGLMGRASWAGAYGPLVMACLAIIAARTDHVDFRHLTNERAARVATALEAYRAREGRYPAALSELIPRYRLTLTGPVIINGQDWCYRAGTDHYELGYVDRDHWSSPILVGQVYSARGTAPAEPALCAAEIVALQAPLPVAEIGLPWPLGGGNPLAGVEAGMTRAEVQPRFGEAWHRDGCAADPPSGDGYFYTELFWYSSRDVTQSTVAAVHYKWAAGLRQWVVTGSEIVERSQLYERYDRCSSLDLGALADRPIP